MAQWSYMNGFASILVLVVAAAYALYGLILSYHWFRFSTSLSLAVLSAALYYIAGAICAAMALAAIALI